LKAWREGKPDGPILKVEEENASWRIERLPGGELVVSSGADSYLRWLVAPGVAIREACQRLKEVPGLRDPGTAAERAAAHLCAAAEVRAQPPKGGD